MLYQSRHHSPAPKSPQNRWGWNVTGERSFPAGHPVQLLFPQKAAPAFLRQTVSIPSSPQWVPGAGAQCRAVFGPGTGTWVEVPTAPVRLQLPHASNSFVGLENEQLPQELHGKLPMSWEHLASLCCSKTSQRTLGRNPAPCWDLAAHPQPRGLDCASQSGSNPRWLPLVLVPCPVQVRLVNAGGFQELVFLLLWHAGSI